MLNITLRTFLKKQITPIILILIFIGFMVLGGKNSEKGIVLSGSAVGGENYVLAGSGVTSSATSLTLTSFTIPGGDTKITTTDFGGLGCGTIEPGNKSRQEFVSFTGVTQNSDGTATLTGLSRGLSPITPYTASTTLQHAHAGGVSFVISNSPPCFYEGYANLGQDESITGLWNFNSYLPTTSITATTSNQFANKDYVDAVANAGAATSTETNGGIVELGTQIEMASSTGDNWATKPRVIQSRYATSTPDGTSQSGLYVPVSKNNGKLHQLWLDLTEVFNFSGGVLNTASSTFTATTTIMANSPNNRLVLNGVDYQFPSSEGASSTIPATDGNGSLSFNTLSDLGAAKFLFGSTTDAVYVDTDPANSTTLYTIPANTLTTSGAIRFRLYISNVQDSSSDSTITFYIKLGGTTIASGGMGMTNTPYAGVMDVILYANGATNSQVSLGNLILSSGANMGAGALATEHIIDTTSSIDMTQAQAVTYTVDLNSNLVSTEQYTIAGMTIEFLGR